MFRFPSPRADLILIHPPSVFDFRKRKILFGPISDVVPSTPAFEMYPIGFSSISEHLSKNDVSVRIVNLAYLMLTGKDFDVREFLSRLKARAFGISLHWLPHAHGAVELARLLKEIHPEVPVIFGGYSSTYFHEEIIELPYVDFVVRGDSTERALLSLMRAIKNGAKTAGELDDIPNLTRMKGGGVRVNDELIVEESLNDFSNNYLNLFRKSVKYFDIKGMTPIYDWWRYPITMMVTCRGCGENCVICGGSNFAMRKYLGRKKVAFRDPGLVARDILSLSRYTSAPIFVVGDLLQAGHDYAETLIKRMGKKRIANQMVFEFFNPAPEAFFEKVSRVFPNVNYEISPETHDDEVRKMSGKRYKTEAMEDSIGWALKHGAKKFDVFFMIGISGQDKKSVMETVEYSGYLMERFGKRLSPFISPLAPFVDPGSMAFEQPEKHGYKILFKSFSEHVEALNAPSWKYMLNYETKWLTRDGIVSATYDSGARMNELKLKGGHIDRETYLDVKGRLDRDVKLMSYIDKMCIPGRGGIEGIEGDRTLMERGIDLDDIGIVCGEEEIKWPVVRSGFRFFNIGIAIAFETIKRGIGKLCRAFLKRGSEME
ncbi:MAG: TIGR04190 family B12-binding domain/radical SAM domain protein [Deltaproteobacteria bacterium]|uniref:TIGR04190 family B12-binding domain/radical SAM domain protein n=1 Tax=Candidatus Zymogenus saltonus TaxID=2844893 RepID=A0A9D8KE39_9DELT|nr:TIGR04190 family B12-binding domain/radical SAM domain protein [Candidatus Zymogenus saltonus]